MLIFELHTSRSYSSLICCLCANSKEIGLVCTLALGPHTTTINIQTYSVRFFGPSEPQNVYFRWNLNVICFTVIRCIFFLLHVCEKYETDQKEEEEEERALCSCNWTTKLPSHKISVAVLPVSSLRRVFKLVRYDTNTVFIRVQVMELQGVHTWSASVTNYIAVKECHCFKLQGLLSYT